MSSTPFSAPRVFLVGAGPGDPRLITVRGRDLIALAEVIVHDELANRALLDWAQPQAEIVYVGKRAGHHYAQQVEINRILVAHARTGRLVVRLKGGDPLVFGRGGEEAQALREALGDRTKQVPVVPLNGGMGSLFAGSGSVNLAVAAMALHKQTIPPATNCVKVDPACGLNVPTAAIGKPLRYALTAGYAIGGQAAAMVLKRYE